MASQSTEFSSDGDVNWAEVLFDDESDDDFFEGFSLEEASESTRRRIERSEFLMAGLESGEFDPHNLEVEVSDVDSAEEEDSVIGDPKVGAYECPWLKDFDPPVAVGPIDFDPKATEFEIFMRLFDIEVVGILVDETNRYYRQVIESKGGVDSLPPCSSWRKWVPVTLEEMKAFLAIILYMGVVRMRAYDGYYSTDPLIDLRFFRSIMPRNRLTCLMSFFHAADNLSPEAQTDPCHKIRKVSEKLIALWQKNYYPGREVAVDETLCPFKGRSKHIHYVKSKPHKWGLKVWTMADSGSSYVCNWEFCPGGRNRPRGRPGPDDGEFSGEGTGYKVVMGLCKPFFDRGHHVYCDNFFTSTKLFQALAAQQVGACGTIRRDRRGQPLVVKQAKPKKGAPPHIHREEECLYVTWHDRREVRVLSTIHNSSTFRKTVRSKFHAGYMRQVDQPKAVFLYSQYMGGVDVSDQQLSYNMSQHRCMKWWKKLVLCNLLEVSFANCKVIWKALNKGSSAASHCKSDKFRLAVIHGMLEGFVRRSSIFARPALNPPFRLVERHFPTVNPARTPAGRQSTPDCEVCSDRTVRRCQTPWMCQECEVPMCVEPCFQRYHTLVRFKTTCRPNYHKFGNKSARK